MSVQSYCKHILVLLLEAPGNKYFSKISVNPQKCNFKVKECHNCPYQHIKVISALTIEAIESIYFSKLSVNPYKFNLKVLGCVKDIQYSNRKAYW